MVDGGGVFTSRRISVKRCRREGYLWVQGGVGFVCAVLLGVGEALAEVAD